MVNHKKFVKNIQDRKKYGKICNNQEVFAINVGFKFACMFPCTLTLTQLQRRTTYQLQDFFVNYKKMSNNGPVPIYWIGFIYICL